MRQITVKEMAAALNAEVKKGNGDKMLITADDNEGNGYHGVFYTISPAKGVDSFMIGDSVTTDTDKLLIIG